MKKIPHDIIGDIAILKFSRDEKKGEKKRLSEEFLKQNKHIKTVLEKTDKIKGRLRIAKTSFLAGENKKITNYKENDCRFLINVDETYFSSRLSNHRKEIGLQVEKLIKKNKESQPQQIAGHSLSLQMGTKRSKIKSIWSNKKYNILVMFAGIAPLPIVIAKILKQKSKLNQVQIISNEINKNASKYAEENIRLNKFQDNIKAIQCDAKNLGKKLGKYRADIILMPRPNLRDTFLQSALKLSKKGTVIFYHGFGIQEKVVEEIKEQCKNKISKIKIKRAGDIGKDNYRWLAEFSVR